MATASDETTGCGRRDWKKPSKYSVCCSVERYGSPVFAFTYPRASCLALSGSGTHPKEQFSFSQKRARMAGVSDVRYLEQLASGSKTTWW